MTKEYLGDAVYAELHVYADGFYEVDLTTGDSQGMRIVLEPKVLDAFQRFIAEHLKKKD